MVAFSVLLGIAALLSAVWLMVLPAIVIACVLVALFLAALVNRRVKRNIREAEVKRALEYDGPDVYGGGAPRFEVARRHYDAYCLPASHGEGRVLAVWHHAASSTEEGLRAYVLMPRPGGDVRYEVEREARVTPEELCELPLLDPMAQKDYLARWPRMAAVKALMVNLYLQETEA